MNNETTHIDLEFEPSLKEEMNKYGKHLTKSEGETVMKSGDSIHYIPILISGVLKVFRIDENGREILLYYILPEESCAMSFMCCMQHKISNIEVVAEKDSEMMLIPVEYMEEWMDKYHSWKNFVMDTLLTRFDELINAIDHLVFQRLDERLVDYLKEKSRVTNSSLINLSHDQIAQELATSRVVISRLLKKLENQNKLLLYRHQIKLLKAM